MSDTPLSEMTPGWVKERNEWWVEPDGPSAKGVRERDVARALVAAEIGRAVVAQGAKIKKFKQDKDEEYVSQTYAMAMFALGETTIKAFAALEGQE